jgi:hypothetical protein
MQIDKMLSRVIFFYLQRKGILIKVKSFCPWMQNFQHTNKSTSRFKYAQGPDQLNFRYYRAAMLPSIVDVWRKKILGWSLIVLATTHRWMSSPIWWKTLWRWLPPLLILPHVLHFLRLRNSIYRDDKHYISPEYRIRDWKNQIKIKVNKVNSTIVDKR